MAISPITIGGTSTDAARSSAGGCGCGGCGCGADEASNDTGAPATAVQAATAPTTAAYAVESMTCGHCVSAVTQELFAVPGVTDVKVELVVGGRSAVTVLSEAPLDEADVRAAVDKAGYQLAGQV